MTLSDATTPGQSELESDGNKEVLLIPQSYSITGTSPSDCLVPYPPAEKQSVYSTTPADWAIHFADPIGKKLINFMQNILYNDILCNDIT